MKSNKETNEATIKYFVSDDGNINEHHFSDMRRVLDQDPGLFFIPILNKYNKLQFPLFILADLIRTTSHGRIHEKFSNLFKELYFSIIKELATSENSKQKLTNLKDDDGMNIFQTLATSCHEWAISVLQRLLDQNLISISNIVPEGDKLIFVFPHKSLPMILFLLKSGVKQEDIIAYDPPALNKAGHFSQIVEIPLVHYFVKKGMLDSVQWALKNGLNLNIADSYGYHAIDYLGPILRNKTLTTKLQQVKQFLLDNKVAPTPEIVVNMPESMTPELMLLTKQSQAEAQKIDTDRLAQLNEASKDIQTILSNRDIKVEKCASKQEVELLIKGQEYREFIVDECDGIFTVTSQKKLSLEDEKKLVKYNQPYQSAIMKNKIGWELIARESAPQAISKYLQQYEIKQQKFGNDLELSFFDLRTAEDYRFIVNTIVTRPSRLQELEEGDPKFFQTTPYLSCCVLDKITRGFAGGHQTNDIFPLYMVLEVPVNHIAYMGPTDIGSPYATTAEKKLTYLESVEANRTVMNLRHAFYQQHDRAENECPRPPSAVFSHLKSDSMYSSQGYKQSGTVPFFTVEQLLSDTNLPTFGKNAYCELIVKGNAFSAAEDMLHGQLLLVDKYYWDKFLEEYPQKTGNIKKLADECLQSLRSLTNPQTGRLKLALIETDTLGYKAKLPVKTQIALLEKDKENMQYTLECLAIQRARQQEDTGKVTSALEEDFARVMNDYNKIVATQQGIKDLIYGKKKGFGSSAI